MIKTNSSKSAKTNKEMEIPYYDDTGFMSPIDNGEDMPITISPEMDESQKEIITEMLIEKGILFPDAQTSC
jgi:hypothetical protein